MPAAVGSDQGHASVAPAARSAHSSGNARLDVRSFRNHEAADLQFEAGTTVLHGPTGAGKTNLLEAVHFALTGKSCRSSNDRDVIKFGARAARAAVTIVGADEPHTFETSLEAGRAKLMKIDGVVANHLPGVADKPHVCVFMPDHLELVKGAARVRRERFDALVATLWPSRRERRHSYVRALAQRNALIGRVRSGASSADSVGGWNHELARFGLELMADRSSAVELLGPHFTARADELGIEGEATLTYRPRSRATSARELEAELERSFDSDLRCGYTGHGPHRDDYRFTVGGRDSRRFASQGQQRLVLLALILAERDALISTTGRIPLLLLDDVLSELDLERRSRLLATLGAGGQTLVTTAEPQSAWLGPNVAGAVRVEAGSVRA